MGESAGTASHLELPKQPLWRLFPRQKRFWTRLQYFGSGSRQQPRAAERAGMVSGERPACLSGVVWPPPDLAAIAAGVQGPGVRHDLRQAGAALPGPVRKREPCERYSAFVEKQ